MSVANLYLLIFIDLSQKIEKQNFVERYVTPLTKANHKI